MISVSRLLLVLMLLSSVSVLTVQAQDSDGSDKTRVIAKLIGEDSINKTGSNYGIEGADLGHTFLFGGAIYMIFGDTFGVANSDWRSNTGAIIYDDDPSDGLSFGQMIEDIPGHAKELLSSKKFDNDEITVIPTYGFAVGQRMYLDYMSVNHWGEPGHWFLNNSGLAYSNDGGRTWTKDANAIWPGNSNFGQVAVTQVDDTLYFFGIPGGRYGGVQLARVDEHSILDLSAYEYWDGMAWQQDGMSSAKTIVPAPVGELSVRWNSHYKKWLMMYLNETKFGIVLRTADCLTGPWSDGQIIVNAVDYPQLYSPYMLPKWNDRAEVYFTMSQFGPYAVYLMQTELDNVTPSTEAPECVTPQ